MSQEHEQPTPDTHAVSDAIRPEAAPFEPGYQPGTLPQIQVPDLPDDAQGLSAEALAQVPTLTELVDGEEVAAPDESEVSEPVQTPDEVSEETVSLAVSEGVCDASIQEEPAQADTWGEQLHVRMGKLTDDIQSLNARLDRFEERSKTKV
jgi:hypothetical protein